MMPPGGVRFTQTHKVTRVYYSGREDDDDAPKKTQGGNFCSRASKQQYI